MNGLLITCIGDKKKAICNSNRHVVCQITDAVRKRYSISVRSHEDSRVGRKCRLSILSLTFGTRRTTHLSGLSASLTLPTRKNPWYKSLL